MQISVSFLSSAYSFDKTIERINASQADFIHVDVMDGLLVNHVTNFTKEKLILLQNSPKPKEIHLMTLHLKKYIDIFACLNPESIIYEFEATEKHQQVIRYIKKKKIKAGIAIGPLTEIEKLTPYLKDIDLVLVMGVIPGSGGQAFLKKTVDRIEKLQKLKEEKKLSFLISVDGGINDQTIKSICDKGLNRAVAGSYICKSINFNEKIANLKMEK